MDNTISFPSRDSLLQNFYSCINWEEKYSYIMDLGCRLPSIPKKTTFNKHLIPGCQSKVWIAIEIISMSHKKNIVKFYGDSDSAITKGILCIIFIIYQGLTIKESIHFNPYPFLHELNLNNHLTHSRSQGIHSILQFIRHQLKNLHNSQYLNH